MHYLLFYEAGEDYVAKRAQFRSQHLEKAWKASERGELVLGGALANPVDGAVLLFKGDSPEVAENFARTDPYVTSGMVKRWYVREWTTVAGAEAATPVGRETNVAFVKDENKSPNPSLDRASSKEGAILRMWRGTSTGDQAEHYIRHVTRTVLPKLRRVEGQRGAYLLRRNISGASEFVVLTLWDSMEAVRRFAGDQPDKAVVEPEARAVLNGFDEFVTHFEVVTTA
jgi:uncharacterized protein YciI/heme-degrading monooxygenase HmoA